MKAYGRKERRAKNIGVEDFVDELAKEFNLPKDVILKICKSEFKYVNHVIKQNKFESVRLMYLGIFGISSFRLQYIPEHLIELTKNSGAELDKSYPEKSKKSR